MKTREKQKKIPSWSWTRHARTKGTALEKPSYRHFSVFLSIYGLSLSEFDIYVVVEM